MPTPASTTPPTEETRDAYRAAVLAYREAFAGERRRRGVMRANPHVPNRAAADAVKAVRPDLDDHAAGRLAHEATSWAAQTHTKWFWSAIPADG